MLLCAGAEGSGQAGPGYWGSRPNVWPDSRTIYQGCRAVVCSAHLTRARKQASLARVPAQHSLSLVFTNANCIQLFGR